MGISDHFAIACNRKINFSMGKNRKINFSMGKNSHKEIQYRTIKTFDENAFLCDLSSAPWHQIEAFDNIDDILAAWYSLSIAVIDKHVAIRTHQIKHDIQADWLTSEILDKIKQRDKMKKNTVDMTIIKFYVTWYLLKIKIQNRHNTNQRRQVRTILNHFGHSLKNSVLQTRKKDNTDCFKLNIDDNLFTDTKAIADTFNDYFVNIAILHN